MLWSQYNEKEAARKASPQGYEDDITTEAYDDGVKRLLWSQNRNAKSLQLLLADLRTETI